MPGRISSIPQLHGEPGIRSDQIDTEHARLAALFNDNADGAMKTPGGGAYQKVAVLLVNWVEKLDDLNTEPEVEGVFRNGYNYKTERLKLSNVKSPQQQLNHGVGRFVLENDGEYNLLIIYYAGHGVYDEDKRVLNFDAARSEINTKNLHPARACWHKVEAGSLKEDVQADVLVILDCCFAGDVDRRSPIGRSDRTYELLAANGPGETTPGPGEHSFTTTLIDVLSEVAGGKKKISTFDLCANIARKRERGYQPVLFRRFELGEKHIELAPLCAPSVACSQGQSFPPNLWELPMLLAFAEQPTEEQIKQLAWDIPALCKDNKLPLVRVRWMQWGFGAATGVFMSMLWNQRRRVILGSQGDGGGGANPRNVADMRVLAKKEVEVPAEFAVGGRVQISELVGGERRAVYYVVESRERDPDGTWSYLVREDGGSQPETGKWVRENRLRRR
ncbi:hypothetical protein FGG08_005641 [Glutinoglossum americanum]|uniref:Peptidase C14 caspase domain-containing protein n=1 Tax=Glutinoglossum americanum TaxID=1670608 RepID=A0A9P8HXS8_9PEZI|nr:hypothetical protein FGG08_005641 [Glutinoglossum americanum]